MPNPLVLKDLCKTGPIQVHIQGGRASGKTRLAQQIVEMFEFVPEVIVVTDLIDGQERITIRRRTE